MWAGNRWGAFFWPRIGHEVVVSFEDGDPDQPLVVGSVYNAANMPPLELPVTNLYCGIKSSSIRGRANENYNCLVFVDKKGQEHLAIHSERHMVLNAEFDVAARSGRHHTQRVSGAQVSTVGCLIGGGGSGGGSGQSPAEPVGIPASGGSGGAPATNQKTFLGQTSGTTWAQPHPQSVFGLSSSVVYGSAFTTSFPLSFQLAGGSLVKLIVDPIGFHENLDLPPKPPANQQVMGDGFLGSVQLTLGTSANITMGQVYDLHVGPPPVRHHLQDKTGPWPLAVHLGWEAEIAAGVFTLAYALLPQEDNEGVADLLRSFLVMGFQTLIQIILTTLVGAANAADLLARTKGITIEAAYATLKATPSTDQYIDHKGWEYTTFIAMLLTPFLMDSIGEGALITTSSSSSTKSSSSGSSSSK